MAICIAGRSYGFLKTRSRCGHEKATAGCMPSLLRNTENRFRTASPLFSDAVVVGIDAVQSIDARVALYKPAANIPFDIRRDRARRRTTLLTTRLTCWPSASDHEHGSATHRAGARSL